MFLRKIQQDFYRYGSRILSVLNIAFVILTVCAQSGGDALAILIWIADIRCEGLWWVLGKRCCEDGLGIC